METDQDKILIPVPHKEDKIMDYPTDDLEVIPVEELLQIVGNTFVLSNPRRDIRHCRPLYKTRVAVAPCLCCGQEDHALVKVYGKGGEMITERVTCPVSQYEKSINRVTTEEGLQRFGAINPWKFVREHGAKENDLARAWDKYRIDGFGRSQTMERNLFEWKAVCFFAEQRRIGNTDEETAIVEELLEDKNHIVWPRNRWVPSGPPVKKVEYPFNRNPCVLCGSDDHAADEEREDEGTTTKICPLFDQYDKERNCVIFDVDIFARMSGYDENTAEETLDKFQFQGMAWELDIDLMDKFRERVLAKCREIRASWTFKRDNLHLDKELTNLSFTEEAEDCEETDDF